MSARPSPREARWLVRFGYEGSTFYGWARQPGRRTVEGEILRALEKDASRSGPRVPVRGIAVASRTDRGVSARRNVLALDSPLAPETLLRRLNAIDSGIYFTAAVRMRSGFRLRRPLRRIYRYFETKPEGDPARYRAAALLFAGPVDVRSFGRAIPGAAPCWRAVERIDVRNRKSGLQIEVRAPSFVWGMVRKIVGGMREVGSGRLPLARLEGAIRGRERLTLPIAEPSGLVLWDVEYPRLRWAVRWSGPNRHQWNWIEQQRRELAARATIFDSLLDPPPGPRLRVPGGHTP